MTNRLIRPILLFIGIIPLLALIVFMVAYGKSEYPFGDTNITMVDTAVKTANGSLEIADLFQIHYGHRIFFTRLLTAITTALNNWDTRIEVWANPLLGILCWLVIIWIFARYQPKRVAWILFPAGVFILTTDQALNWLAGIHNSWHFALLFALLGVLSLTYTHKKWRSLLIAISWGFCATFSMAPGLVVWGVLLITLISLNYRDWKHYLGLFIAGGIAVGLYFSNTGMGGGWSSPEYGRIIIPDPLHFIQFVLILFGRPIINNITYAPWVGGIAIFVFWANIFIFWRRNKTWIGISVWLPIAAYSVGNAILLAVSRYYYFGMSIALTERYLHPTLPFWVATFAVCIININPKRLVSGVNISFMLMILILHGLTLSREWAYLEFDLPVEGVQIQGDCLSRFPISQYAGCWDASKHSPDIANLQLTAAWRLAGYARIPQTMILPAHSDDKLIINTETIWQGIHIRDFLLAGTDVNHVLNIATDGQQSIFADEISQIPAPPQHATFGYTPDIITEFVGDDSNVWYITRPQLYADETLWEYRAWLEESFAPAYRAVTSDNVIITRYIRPFKTSETASFGDDIIFMGYQFVGDADFGACETITLQTAWQAKNIPQTAMQLSLALVDSPITRSIINTDGQVSPIPVQFWESGGIYYDERYLTIPCDLPIGDYLLTITLYPITDKGEALLNLSISNTELQIEGHLLVIGGVEVK